LSLNNLKLIEEYQRLSWKQEPHQLLKNPLLQKDVWHIVEDLKLKVNEHNRYLNLYFSQFSQEWFKLLVKLYILTKAKSSSNSITLVRYLSSLKTFSKFLEDQSIYSPHQINDQVFEALDYHLRSTGRKQGTIASYYQVFTKFFDTCRIEGWFDVNTYWFRGKLHIHYPKNDQVEYLPEEVWNQLNKNLHYLPEPLQRMVLLLRTLGLRIGEICNMPFDCLRKRGKKWRLRLTTEKYDTEDELPIVVPELVAVIKEQQRYIRQHLGEEYNKLFCTSKGGKLGHKKDGDEMLFEPGAKVMLLSSFNRWLNRLAIKCNIRSKDDQIWKFKSHQFRRTVATVMANAGVRDLIIQKYLRHRSIDMQNHYIHLLKQVLGKEFEELMREKKYVDITGNVVASHKPKNPVTELLRRRMYQITTQYGECHRPVLKAPCQTVNACWRCKEWRTSIDDLPYLKDDWKRVEQELQIAEKMGMIRQQQGLKSDRDSLLSCIKGLEQFNA